MRNEVRVIWLEDSIRGTNKRPHESRFKAVKEHIESKGYQPNIKVVTNISEAKSLLTIRGGEERYDFFISDFDLGGGTDAEKGLDYLVEVRKSKNYKRFFVLYSRNEYSTISQKVVEKLQDEENINLFTNFSFISVATDDKYTIKHIEQKFKESIDIGLARWDELNAIRGMYMCEHAELEDKLKSKQLYDDYSGNIQSYCVKFSIAKEIEVEWDRQRKIRNALAHVSEAFDYTRNCFYIESNEDPRIKIYENDLDRHRRDLRDLRDKLNL